MFQPVFIFKEAYYVPRLHDAMYLYGLALNKTLQAGGEYKSGTGITNAVKRLKFDGIYEKWPKKFASSHPVLGIILGASGKIVMDSFSERIPEFVIYGRNADNNDLTPLYNLTVSFTDSENYIYVTN